MNERTKLRIGLQGARELELEVEDAETARKAIESALEESAALVWITDAKGHSYGLVADKLAFVHVEGPTDRAGIGFGAGD